MPNQTIKIFIASSSELQDDRDDFRKFIGDENIRLNASGIFLELVCWENFPNAMSENGLQAEYNKALKACDMAVFLIFSKVGKFTEQEFDVALNSFTETQRPKIWTYFKNEALYPESIRQDEIETLFAFKSKIRDLNHYRTKYVNIYDLKYQFKIQLDLSYPALFAPAPPAATVPVDVVVNTPIASNVKNSFNEVLTYRLFESIRQQNDRAKELYENADFNGITWQDSIEYRNVAKDIIASTYVGALGVQLRKLMAIGMESFSVEKQQRYVLNCHLAVLRALQLLCFTLLSKLWDEKEKNYQYSPDQLKVLCNFFNSTIELNVIGFSRLLVTLTTIFNEKGIDYPITELKEFSQKLQPDSKFLEACTSLQSMLANQATAPLDENSCSEAENALTTVLEDLSFLVNYNMESIKNIEYFGIRNTAQYYQHNFTALSLDENSSIDRDQVKVSNLPLNTYAVLLYNNKIDYQPKLNLFPFIIDANALAAEKGAKIYFYASTGADDSLNYTFWEDKENKICITDPEKLTGPATANSSKTESEKFDLKRSTDVFKLFRDAEQVITGVPDQVQST